MFGVLQDSAGQIDDRIRHRRGEEERLASFGEKPDHLSHVMDESHVEHAVCFVDDEDLKPIEAQVALIDQVEEAPWGGYENFGSSSECLNLGILTDAAEDHFRAKGEMCAIGEEALIDLDSKLPGRSNDEDTWTPRSTLSRILGKVLEDGQRECCGLAGSCLGAAHDVVPFENERNGLLLDRRWSRVVPLPEGALDGFAECKRRE